MQLLFIKIAFRTVIDFSAA